MKFVLTVLSVILLCSRLSNGQAVDSPTLVAPLVVSAATKEVQVFGIIYPARFNAAQGDEAHYHLLVWQGGLSPNALIETPVDDLALHDALFTLGAQPGNNLTMSSWNQRHDAHSVAPLEKVTGSAVDVRLSWDSNPTGLPIDQAFSQVSSLKSQVSIDWHFGGNRDRWFNRVPLAPRPGCLACLYSCPSGKVSNGALSIHDYITAPSRFTANTDILPPDGTPVVVTFRVLP